MSESDAVLATTTGLCPTCLERVPGRYEARDGAVVLTRNCPDHGTTSRRVWDSLDHWEWAADAGPSVAGDPDRVGEGDDGNGDDSNGKTGDVGDELDTDDGCCGDDECCSGESRGDGGFAVAGDHACLAVVEVTQDCNLSCSYCFAGSGPGGTHRDAAEIEGLLETVREEAGDRPVQFSGGEPTVREDLPDLVERARDLGLSHVQVNTNGLRLAREDGYAELLAEAGVTAVYLQFDGLDRGTYETIREADVLDAKHEAVEACRAADLPVILVPTVVPGVNDDELGDVVRFALDNLDVVRSVNVQPVAHFGRYAKNEGRFSLDEAARRLADQLDGLEPRDLLPVPCCSSYCQLATALAPLGDGVLPLTRLLDEDDFGAVADRVDEADWIDLLAGTPDGAERASSVADCCGGGSAGGLLGDGGCCGGDAGDAGGLGDLGGLGDADLDRLALPVTVTGFMDADAGDAERLENCCISVPTPDGDLVPFCGYNMTDAEGRYALRNRNGWGGRPAVDEPAPAAGTPEGQAPHGSASGSDDD